MSAADRSTVGWNSILGAIGDADRIPTCHEQNGKPDAPRYDYSWEKVRDS